MKLQRLLAIGALGLASSLLIVPSALADDAKATVSILHGVPDVIVDVYVNGKILLDDFKPGTLTDPQMLPAGKYDLKVVKGDAPDVNADAIVEAKGVTVPGGANITIVAHFTEAGDVALTPFVNDTSASKEGGRITVRHVAKAPAVDVRAGGKAVISGLVNPKEAMLNIATGTLNVDVVAAGTDTVVLGPADVKVEDGKNLIVYAYGTLGGEGVDALALTTQLVDLMKAGDKPSKPGMPHTGAEGPASFTGTAAGLMGVAAMAGVAVMATRRRTHAEA